MHLIKWRVWDKKLHCFTLRPKDIIPWGPSETDDYVIQFFAGFGDKNGKEIYIGDIVSIFDQEWDRDNFRPGAPIQTIATVELRVDCLGLFHNRLTVLFKEYNFLSFLDIVYAGKEKEMSVIGNVYQNLELLKNEYPL